MRRDSISLKLRLCSACNSPQHVFCENAAGAKPDPFAHQRSQQVFTLFANVRIPRDVDQRSELMSITIPK